MFWFFFLNVFLETRRLRFSGVAACWVAGNGEQSLIQPFVMLDVMTKDVNLLSANDYRHHYYRCHEPKYPPPPPQHKYCGQIKIPKEGCGETSLTGNNPPNPRKFYIAGLQVLHL